MITAEQVDNVIKKALSRFKKPCNAEIQDLQVVFRINGDNADYQILTKLSPVFTVTLSQLIGSGIFNYLVEGRITGLLKKICTEPGMNILAGVQGDQVYYQVRQNETIIRAIKADEFLN